MQLISDTIANFIILAMLFCYNTSALCNFADKQVSLSRPSVIIGEGNTVQQLSGSVCVSIPCRSSYGDFAVDVSLQNVSASQTNRPAVA